MMGRFTADSRRVGSLGCALRRTRAALTSAVLTSAVLTGAVLTSAVACQKKAAESSKVETSSSAPATAAPEPEGETTQLLRAMVDNCSFNLEHAVISRCKNREKRALADAFREQKRNRLEALFEMVSALESEDRKLQTSAARILQAGFRDSLGDIAPGAVPKPVASRLLDLIPKLSQPLASAAVGAAVHAAMNAGLSKELYAMLDSHPDLRMRASAYNLLMVHGGMNAFPKVKALLDEKDSNVAAAAMRNGLLLPKSERTEGSPMCELAVAHLADLRPLVALRAGQIVKDCGEAALDKLLDDLTQRHQERRVHAGFSQAVDDLCGEPHSPGTPAQCTRLRKLFLEVIAQKDHREEVRAACLVQLATQFPDPAIEALAKRYEKDESARLRAFASKALRRIEWKRARDEAREKNAASAPSGSAPVSSAAPQLEVHGPGKPKTTPVGAPTQP